jgi:hypothetical protein
VLTGDEHERGRSLAHDGWSPVARTSWRCVAGARERSARPHTAGVTATMDHGGISYRGFARQLDAIVSSSVRATSGTAR